MSPCKPEQNHTSLRVGRVRSIARLLNVLVQAAVARPHSILCECLASAVPSSVCRICVLRNSILRKKKHSHPYPRSKTLLLAETWVKGGSLRQRQKRRCLPRKRLCSARSPLPPAIQKQ